MRQINVLGRTLDARNNLIHSHREEERILDLSTKIEEIKGMAGVGTAFEATVEYFLHCAVQAEVDFPLNGARDTKINSYCKINERDPRFWEQL